MHALRSYRLVPTLLALSLVLTAAMPLVRHSCGMTLMDMAEKPCCKGEAEHHNVPATPSHEGMTAHGAPSESAMPCHDTPASDTPEPPCSDTSDGLTLHTACCSSAEAPAAPALERVQPVQASLLALAAAFVLPTLPSADAHASPPANFYPPAPAALHVLYGSFLT